MQNTSLNTILKAKAFSLIGDKAFDFALPLAIISLSTNSLLLAGLFICARKILVIFFMPKVGRIMDRIPCLKFIGIMSTIQIICILALGFIFYKFSKKPNNIVFDYFHTSFILLFIASIFDSIRQTCSLSSDISYKNYWVPKLFLESVKNLTNIKMKTLDLVSEVVIPFLVAIIFFNQNEQNTVPTGLFWVGFLNILSFFPEYFYLNKIATHHQELTIVPNLNITEPVISTEYHFFTFLKDPIFLCQFSYCFLGATVLSSHSLFFRGYLLQYKNLPESEIGVFGGLGALSGVVGVQLFHFVNKRKELLYSTRLAIFFQFIMILLSALFYSSTYMMILFVVLSRAGLFAFTVGITQIQQDYILENKRGPILGYTASISEFFTLIILILGTVFSEYNQFFILVAFSVFAIGGSFILFTIWTEKENNRILKKTVMVKGL